MAAVVVLLPVVLVLLDVVVPVVVPVVDVQVPESPRPVHAQATPPPPASDRIVAAVATVDR